MKTRLNAVKKPNVLTTSTTTYTNVRPSRCAAGKKLSYSVGFIVLSPLAWEIELSICMAKTSVP